MHAAQKTTTRPNRPVCLIRTAYLFWHPQARVSLRQHVGRHQRNERHLRRIHRQQRQRQRASRSRTSSARAASETRRPDLRPLSCWCLCSLTDGGLYRLITSPRDLITKAGGGEIRSAEGSTSPSFAGTSWFRAESQSRCSSMVRISSPTGEVGAQLHRLGACADGAAAHRAPLPVCTPIQPPSSQGHAARGTGRANRPDDASYRERRRPATFSFVIAAVGGFLQGHAATVGRTRSVAGVRPAVFSVSDVAAVGREASGPVMPAAALRYRASV